MNILLYESNYLFFSAISSIDHHSKQHYGTLGMVNPIRTGNVTQRRKCSDLCKKRRNCKYWTWYDDFWGNGGMMRMTINVCFTMTNASILAFNWGCVSGNKHSD